MGQNSSSDLRKSYHTLPQLVHQFQENNPSDSFEYNSKNNVGVTLKLMFNTIKTNKGSVLFIFRNY